MVAGKIFDWRKRRRNKRMLGHKNKRQDEKAPGLVEVSLFFQLCASFVDTNLLFSHKKLEKKE